MDRANKKFERKNRILAAATKEFAQKGFQAGSTDQIALEAGVSKGLIYHYFGEKKNLYLEVVTQSIAKLEGASQRMETRKYENLETLILEILNLKLQIEKDYQDEVHLLMEAYGQIPLFPVEIQLSIQQAVQQDKEMLKQKITETISQIPLKKEVEKQKVIDLVQIIVEGTYHKVQCFLAEHPKIKNIKETTVITQEIATYMKILQFGFCEKRS